MVSDVFWVKSSDDAGIVPPNDPTIHPDFSDPLLVGQLGCFALSPFHSKQGSFGFQVYVYIYIYIYVYVYTF